MMMMAACCLTATASAQYVVVLKDGVNIRKNDKVVGKAKAGDRFDLSRGGVDWNEVYFKDDLADVSTKFSMIFNPDPVTIPALSKEYKAKSGKSEGTLTVYPKGNKALLYELWELTNASGELISSSVTLYVVEVREGNLVATHSLDGDEGIDLDFNGPLKDIMEFVELLEKPMQIDYNEDENALLVGKSVFKAPKKQNIKKMKTAASENDEPIVEIPEVLPCPA